MRGMINTTSIADGMPFDPSLISAPLDGKIIQYNASLGLWTQSNGSFVPSGVTPPFIFSKDGAVGVGTYLRVGNVVSSQGGYIIRGNNTIVGLTLTTSQVYNVTTVVKIQRRTGVATFVDIAGCTVSITGNNIMYSNTVTFATPIAIGPDWELCAVNASGTTLQNAVLCLYVQPA